MKDLDVFPYSVWVTITHVCILQDHQMTYLELCQALFVEYQYMLSFVEHGTFIHFIIQLSFNIEVMSFFII